jgi:regulator of nucleoside diphosphate kinase
MTNLTGQPQRNLGEEVEVGKKKNAVPVLPPITVTADDMRRLNALASSSEELFPRVAHFLAREMERATEVEDSTPLNGIIRMGSQVRYRDDKTGEVKDVVLVYPHEADIALKRISVLTPVGAALIGLSMGQSIEFSTPGDRSRSVTVLGVEN